MEKLKEFLEESKAAKVNTAEDPAHIHNRVQETMDHLAFLSGLDEKTRKLKSGIAPVDEFTGGLAPGEMVILGGDDQCAQTALSLQYAIQTAETLHKPVQIYSEAHAPQQLVIRLLAMLTGVPVSVIESGRMLDDQWIKLSTAGAWLSRLDICIYETTGDVEQLCRRIVTGGEITLLILDGVFEQGVAPKTLWNLRRLAKRLQCSILVNGFRLYLDAESAEDESRRFWLDRTVSDEFTLSMSFRQCKANREVVLCWDQSCLRFIDAPGPMEEDEENCF